MIHLLPYQIPWFVSGPAIGLLVVGLYALVNRPLGASGAYVQTIEFFRGGVVAEPWRVWYLAGILAGGLAAALLRGGPITGFAYGPLGHALPMILLVPVLFGAGTLMGYGARWMGGCTSGHGICGTSALSPASIAATSTFFGTAIVVSVALDLVTGGAL
ncbi:MAG TPA: YeeE/YedE thiosulfate transporter family protein [Chloroflexota bacterium]